MVQFIAQRRKVAKESKADLDLDLKQEKEFGSMVFFARLAALREAPLILPCQGEAEPYG